MDQSIQRALNDKIYDKRKLGALDLERVIRDHVANKDFDKIKKIIQQLCNDFAYQVNAPNARNGGLIGLAGAAIALGPELARYLDEIVPPVLACFTDQDARVRYYACESMYNIAKVAKGEVLPYFNDIFDALCKLGADSELSVKNGAELLDRLIKDIVSESAATYVSVLHTAEEKSDVDQETPEQSIDYPTAFSLRLFIPLLKERIAVINPFTRTFLVSWIILLDSIPDLELVTYLPEFLAGLFRFLSDPNRDVHVATRGSMDRFLTEIKRITRIKKGIEESRKSRSEDRRKKDHSIDSTGSMLLEGEVDDEAFSGEEDDVSSDDDWVPGQDAQINYKEVLEILATNLDRPYEEEGLLETLRWIAEFLDICPEEVLPFTPKVLAHLLPAMANSVDSIRSAATRVNSRLMDYVISLSDDVPSAPSRIPTSVLKDPSGGEQKESLTNPRTSLSNSRELDSPTPPPQRSTAPTPVPTSTPPTQVDLDYAAAVNSLTLLFLNDHEATRVAALGWLLMLHKKAPKKVLAFNDGTFPALLKTLSDPAEAVVTKDLQLLSQISRNSGDDYFSSFMENLLQLFSTDRKLLEARGNLIIRQLCVSLSPERIYRTLADCIEKEEDLEFASIMVQNLNNNLITAPQLADLRKRLRNLETKDGQVFFVALFRSWCYNAVATFSLCLLAQAYEQAYNLLQIIGELEMTVNMLIQIDKLVQLLESPVFTYLRMHLLEPEKHPHLYKCMYGLLMLLPQSSAFAALKNRLNSVSAIGYLHIAPRAYVSQSRNSSVAEAISTFSSTTSTSTNPLISHQRKKSSTESYSSTSTTANAAPSTFDRSSRLKGRDEGGIRWGELLEKFKSVQEKARRAQQLDIDGGFDGLRPGDGLDVTGFKENARLSQGPPPPAKDVPSPSAPSIPKPKPSKFGRLGGGRPKR
ncbi:vacuolar protein 14 C-terminal Fig4p binding-domain-containing protein [Calycina marina]|uniref:Vacuolar protein 14 C-terminal Fig4p binding-domain-containing protein n=1 Tax=Calycina marina TaxID=1763456 RepID=A0A9P8CJM7_9HELO|nr:vacuolar protein 14 C-terminal Fig4p binding-domain-containing protein [Calycina marina]